jgi:succinate dehydrogenase / fumarate reductase, cytochrome b subunit
MNSNVSPVSVKQHRPLSPHLQVYKPQITSVMSILHRITGVALTVGTIPLVLWLWAVAYDAALFTSLHAFFNAWYGMVLMVGWSAAFYYHLANGIRHMYWDTARGFSIKSVDMSGIITIVFVLVATSATWIIIMQKGA